MQIAILAGGNSSRFGRDKALETYAGQSMLKHIAAEALQTGLPVAVIGREKPENWSLPEISFLPDDEQDLGPIGGLITALSHANGPVMLCACDMPLLTVDAMRWLLEQEREPAHDGIVTITDRGLEPLFSIYAESVLPKARARVAHQRLSLHGLIEFADFQNAIALPWIAEQLKNVNTPGDLPPQR